MSGASQLPTLNAALVAVMAVVALGCGGAPPPPPANVEPVAGPARAAPTALERRRDAACDRLGPRLTACAVEDARADFAAGKIDRAQLTADTAPDVQRRLTAKLGGYLVAVDGVRRADDIGRRHIGQCPPVLMLEVGVVQGLLAPRRAALPHAHEPHGVGAGAHELSKRRLGQLPEGERAAQAPLPAVQPYPGVDLIE